jgi:CRP-like cAMP-binding protein
VDLFAGLQPEELRRLAERLVLSPFAAGDVITRQGAEANWLYLVTAGTADVVAESSAGNSTRVAELGPGSVFGEMGLMTGEPRRATVIARTQVECFRLDKESFQEIVRSRPEVADEISALLASRRVELDAAMENLDQEAKRARLASTRRDILGKVRNFFGVERT